MPHLKNSLVRLRLSNFNTDRGIQTKKKNLRLKFVWYLKSLVPYQPVNLWESNLVCPSYLKSVFLFFPSAALWADGHGFQISSCPLSTAQRPAAHLVQPHGQHQGVCTRHPGGREPGGWDSQEDHRGVTHITPIPLEILLSSKMCLWRVQSWQSFNPQEGYRVKWAACWLLVTYCPRVVRRGITTDALIHSDLFQAVYHPAVTLYLLCLHLRHQLLLLFVKVYSALSEGELQLLRQTLLIFFQDMHIRVSALLLKSFSA